LIALYDEQTEFNTRTKLVGETDECLNKSRPKFNL